MFVKFCNDVSQSSTISCGVPQGSVLGPLLFITYIAPIESLIANFSIDHIAYADDLTLYVKLQSHSLLNLSNCLSCVKDWFVHNDLLLNPDKSQCLIVGTRNQVSVSCAPLVQISGEPVQSSDSLKLLGVTFDTHLSFEKHITDICKASFFHIRALQHIRRYLDLQTTKIIAASLIASKLDYCNAVLAGISSHNLNRLQRVQNATARVVLNSKNKSSTLQCKDLHWLPIKQRIDYKIALTTFKSLSNPDPIFLRSLLTTEVPVRSLRSSDHGIKLRIPFCKTELASRSFSVYAPKLWNSLPKPLRDLVNLDSGSQPTHLIHFKSCLKTLFFNAAYFSVA
jgi:hypothetical protein